MTYAIISDIHGNLPAFRAVLADAEEGGADTFLFLGDYASSFPWGNGVVDVIRGLSAEKSVVVIQGNGEGYFQGLRGQTDFPHEQFKPVYWAFRTLSAENLDYLLALPEAASVTDPDNKTQIYLNHSMPLFFRANSPRIQLFHSCHFRKLMSEKIFSHEEYIARASAALLSRTDAMEEIDALPDGIYLFGHNHLQFHMRLGGKLFINPGSCGEPLDWDATAAYTLLTVTESGATVAERRVEYDLHATATALDASEFTAYAPVWSKIMKAELFTGVDYFGTFVKHLRETGQAMGFAEIPVSREVWDAAVKTWEVL